MQLGKQILDFNYVTFIWRQKMLGNTSRNPQMNHLKHESKGGNSSIKKLVAVQVIMKVIYVLIQNKVVVQGPQFYNTE